MTSVLRGGVYPTWNGIGGRFACLRGPSLASASALATTEALGCGVPGAFGDVADAGLDEDADVSEAGRQKASRPTPTTATSTTMMTSGLGPAAFGGEPGVLGPEPDWG